MNGEMHQICCIVAAGKRALQYGEPIQYTPAQYENAITFSCLPGKLFSETKRCIAPRIETWFEFLQSKGLQDIALACPTDVTDKTILGFSNTTESSVLCFYQSGETSYFAPNWQFDPEKRLWNTEYSEYRCPDSPSEKPRFENNTDSFRQALSDIEKLAIQIRCEGFAHIFHSAKNLLDGIGEYPDKKYGLQLPPISHEKLQIFEAASLADVFGGMGSWNDDPLCAAQDMGLEQEYQTLSDRLLMNIRLAILYAINE